MRNSLVPILVLYFNCFHRIRDKDKKKDKKLLFNADKSKIANCVSASTAAQHIEAPIKKDKDNVPDRLIVFI